MMSFHLTIKLILKSILRLFYEGIKILPLFHLTRSFLTISSSKDKIENHCRRKERNDRKKRYEGQRVYDDRESVATKENRESIKK